MPGKQLVRILLLGALAGGLCAASQSLAALQVQPDPAIDQEIPRTQRWLLRTRKLTQRQADFRRLLTAWNQLGIVFFRFDEPDLAVLEIVKKFLVLQPVGFSRPE